MKVKSLFLFCLISAFFISCSDSSDDIDGDQSNKEKAYFSLKLSFPSSTGTTRTTGLEGGDGYQKGLSTEQRFQTVAVILVDASNTVTDYLNYAASDFAPDGNSAGDDNTIVPDPGTATTTYYAKDPRMVSKGDAKVYVFLNPNSEISTKLAVGKSVNSTLMTEITELTSSNLRNSYAKDDNFLMGNAQTPTEITIDGTKTNPTITTVAVERFVSKIVENTTTASFDITNKMGATAVSAAFVDFGLNHLNKRSYLLKQVQTRNDAGAIAGSYVVDPNFVAADYHAFSPESPWYGKDFFIQGNKGISTAFTTTPQIEYCLENTMISNEQYTNKSTSIVYKAALTVNGTSGSTLYTYKNTIFTSYADLQAVYDADNPTVSNALANLFTEAEVDAAYGNSDPTAYSTAVKELNQKLSAKGIKCYYDGECYYIWQIKHWEQDVLLGRMEFGVVRNNVYYLNVKSILTIGEPWVPGGPEDPDPDPDPDEDEDAYLLVNIEVLPWVVRTNNIEF